MRNALKAFNLKAFAAGAGGGLLALAALSAVLAFNASKTQEHLQTLMATKMLVIDKPGFPKAVEEEAHVETVPAAEPHPPSSVIEPDMTPPHAPETDSHTEKPSGKAPLEGMTEKTPQGMLPIIRKSDGMSPFKAYARPYTKSPGLPKIAVVVEGFGLRKDQSEAALALPADVTLLISPYASQPKSWLEKARAAGREIWLDIPIENKTLNKEDPGPRALSPNVLLPENETRLNSVLAQAQGYAGVAGFYTDRFQTVSLMMQNLFEKVFARGLGYLELNPDPPDLLEATAARLKAPYAQTVLHLDDPRFLNKPEDALEIIETRALGGTPVVLVMPAYPKLIEKIVKWEGTLASKGVVLAPLSAVAQTQTDPPAK